MGFTLEQINTMSAEERLQSMECLWNAMIAAGEATAPAWHRDLLIERRRRLESGEDELMSVAESKRRLHESVYAS